MFDTPPRREARLARELEAKEKAEMEAEQARLEEEQKRKRAAARRLKAERENAKAKLGQGFGSGGGGGGGGGEIGPGSETPAEVSEEIVSDDVKPTFAAFVETKTAARATSLFVEDNSLDHLRSNKNAHRRLAGRSFGKGAVVRTHVTEQPLRSASAGERRYM